MTAFARRVASLTGVPAGRLERLAGGDLTEVLLVPRVDGPAGVAKAGSLVSVEAAMLRALSGFAIPAPAVEAEHEGVLIVEHIANDRRFDARAWADIGRWVARLHAVTGKEYGWPSDYALATVALDNQPGSDWPTFWGRQRLATTAAMLDRPWRERVDDVVDRLSSLLPGAPKASLLHGDLWTGNLLVREGRLAAMIDPACCYGHKEADLAMLTLFDAPPPSFWQAYGTTEPGWEDRRHAYQLFPALVHLRLFGSGYAGLVDRLLNALGA